MKADDCNGNVKAGFGAANGSAGASMNDGEEINLSAKHDAESGEYERYFTINEGSVVLDLGAHVGHFSEVAHRKGAFVIAFEPHPINLKWLNRRMPCQNTIVVNGAAWDKNELLKLHECPLNSGAHSLFKHDQCSDVEYTVVCYDIGEFIGLFHLKPDFIKVDTEGAEYRILSSLFQRGIRTSMAIECHSADLYSSCRAVAEANSMTWLPNEVHVGVCYCFPKQQRHRITLPRVCDFQSQS